jgi:hypothetical protein
MFHDSQSHERILRDQCLVVGDRLVIADRHTRRIVGAYSGMMCRRSPIPAYWERMAAVEMTSHLRNAIRTAQAIAMPIARSTRMTRDRRRLPREYAYSSGLGVSIALNKIFVLLGTIAQKRLLFLLLT